MTRARRRSKAARRRYRECRSSSACRRDGEPWAVVDVHQVGPGDGRRGTEARSARELLRHARCFRGGRAYAIARVRDGGSAGRARSPCVQTPPAQARSSPPSRPPESHRSWLRRGARQPPIGSTRQRRRTRAAETARRRGRRRAETVLPDLLAISCAVTDRSSPFQARPCYVGPTEARDRVHHVQRRLRVASRAAVPTTFAPSGMQRMRRA